MRKWIRAVTLTLTLVVLATVLPALAQHSVALSWNESSPNDPAVSFNVKRATSTGAEVKIASTPSLSYTDSTVQSGVTYFYVVTAVDKGGVESGPSNEVSALVPGPTAPVLNNPTVAASMPEKRPGSSDSKDTIAQGKPAASATRTGGLVAVAR